MGLFSKTSKPDLPDFWKAYDASFKTPSPEIISEVRFVVLDTETTGFDYDEDRMLCIGAVTLQNQVIDLNQGFEVFIHQEHYNAETAEIHGILKETKIEQVTELEALQQFLAYLANAVIIAHHTKFDVTMINKALERNHLPKLKNKQLDTAILYKKTLLTTSVLVKKEHYTLDDLADKFDISLKDRHTAMGDAYITAIAFIKIVLRLKEKINVKKLKQLF